jgi:hypothetical protein
VTAVATEPAAAGRTLVDLAEWLADSQNPNWVGRSLTATQEGDSRFYYHPDDPAIRFWSMTHILSMTQRKTHIERWQAATAARTAFRGAAMVDAILAFGDERQAVAWVVAEAERIRSVAAEAGRYLHDVFEALLLGMTTPKAPTWLIGQWLQDEPLTQERLDRWAVGLGHFLDDFQPEVHMAEATVLHPRQGVAGTLDAAFDLPFYGLTIGDLKTGRTVDRTTPMQLEGYRRAPQVVLPLGEIAEKPVYDNAVVIHLRPEYGPGYKVLPMPGGDEVWHGFLDARRQFLNLQDAPPIGRAAWYPPTWDADGHMVPPRTVPMIEDVETPKFPRSALLASELCTWLDELTPFSAADLLSDSKARTGVRKVGPVGLDAIRAALQEHGLTLTGEPTEEVA